MNWLLVCAVAVLASVAFADFDLGDLPPCNYPTFYGNPAHSLSGKAWLGDCITAEDQPHDVNQDECDDGIQYIGLPWTPCTPVTVIVTVTAGPNYDNNPLWLNGWKDGNFDGDFCDELCASEWIVQNAPVSPGVFTFTFMDPGVTDLGPYPGVFRWRLTGRTLDRMGFGMYDPFDCEDSPVCGDFLADSLGEVEDYWIPDGQLAVNMQGQVTYVAGDSRVTLLWNTRREISNDHFRILRDDVAVHNVKSLGNTASGNAYSWTDENLVNGATYHYTLEAVDVANNSETVGTVEATPSAGAVVSSYALYQNYPNPFNPSTSISFDLAESGHVSLVVFNMVGQAVATLENGTVSSGHHTISFDASKLPSGLYVYRLESAGFTDSRKMLLMK